MGITARAGRLSWLLHLPLLLALMGVASCDGGGQAGSAGPMSFDLPTVRNMGGVVLHAPRVQPIYLAGFPYVSDIDRFLGRVATSSYWNAVVGEYGIGRPSIMPGDVSEVPVAGTVDASDMEGLLTQALAAHPALGHARADTIYVLLFAPSTTLTVSGSELCGRGGIDAYHMEVTASGVPVPVAVVAACDSFSGDSDLTGALAITPSLSHELIEAATDPLPFSAPAFADVDA